MVLIELAILSGAGRGLKKRLRKGLDKTLESERKFVSKGMDSKGLAVRRVIIG